MKKNTFLFKSLLSGLLIVSSTTLTGCDENKYNPNSLKDTYTHYVDKYVSTFENAPSNIMYSPIIGEEDYSVLVYQLGTKWKSYNENYFQVKNMEDVFKGCGFTYDDYKSMVRAGDEFKITLPNLKLVDPNITSYSNMTFLDGSDLKAYSLEHNFYYSKDVMNIFRQMVSYRTNYDVTSKEPNGEYVKEYYLDKTMIKGDTLMHVDGEVVTFISHPFLSQTYIADVYRNNKENISNILNSKKNNNNNESKTDLVA